MKFLTLIEVGLTLLLLCHWANSITDFKEPVLSLPLKISVWLIEDDTFNDVVGGKITDGTLQSTLYQIMPYLYPHVVVNDDSCTSVHTLCERNTIQSDAQFRLIYDVKSKLKGEHTSNEEIFENYQKLIHSQPKDSQGTHCLHHITLTLTLTLTHNGCYSMPCFCMYTHTPPTWLSCYVASFRL